MEKKLKKKKHKLRVNFWIELHRLLRAEWVHPGSSLIDPWRAAFESGIASTRILLHTSCMLPQNRGHMITPMCKVEAAQAEHPK